MVSSSSSGSVLRDVNDDDDDDGNVHGFLAIYNVVFVCVHTVILFHIVFKDEVRELMGEMLFLYHIAAAMMYA